MFLHFSCLEIPEKPLSNHRGKSLLLSTCRVCREMRHSWKTQESQSRHKHRGGVAFPAGESHQDFPLWGADFSRFLFVLFPKCAVCNEKCTLSYTTQIHTVLYLQWWALSGLMLQHLGHLYTTCPGLSCKLSMNSLVAFPLGTAPWGGVGWKEKSALLCHSTCGTWFLSGVHDFLWRQDGFYFIKCI